MFMTIPPLLAESARHYRCRAGYAVRADNRNRANSGLVARRGGAVPSLHPAAGDGSARIAGVVGLAQQVGTFMQQCRRQLAEPGAGTVELGNQGSAIAHASHLQRQVESLPVMDDQPRSETGRQECGERVWS